MIKPVFAYFAPFYINKLTCRYKSLTVTPIWWCKFENFKGIILRLVSSEKSVQTLKYGRFATIV